MRLMVARMIANGSLAAFSSLAQPVAPAPVQPVRPLAAPVVRTASVARPTPAAAIPSAKPAQSLPRGSLLDLRV